MGCGIEDGMESKLCYQKQAVSTPIWQCYSTGSGIVGALKHFGHGLGLSTTSSTVCYCVAQCAKPAACALHLVALNTACSILLCTSAHC